MRAEAGITFAHHSAPEKKYIVESMSGGVALFDFDNDGRLDVYFVDSLTVATANDPKPARSALYRNLGGMRFEDVTDQAGVGPPRLGHGRVRRRRRRRRLGRPVRHRAGRQPSLPQQPRRHVRGHPPTGATRGGGWSTGCGFADYDRDGDLDLFVSRYVKIDLAKLPEFGRGKTCEYRGVAVQCGPRGLPGEGDLLFRNDGVAFREVREAAGVSDPRATSAWASPGSTPTTTAGSTSTWPTTRAPASSTSTSRTAPSRRSAFPLGVAVSEDGAEQGGMGVAVGDYDNSGRFSLFKTNFAEEYNNLYRNDGAHFTDVSFRSRTAASSLPYVGWGTAFLDYDNDGGLDIVAVNGHVYPQVDQARLGASAGYRQRKLLYRNRGDGTFDEVAARYGAASSPTRA